MRVQVLQPLLAGGVAVNVVDPCPPFDDLLVVVSAYRSNVVRSHEIQDVEGTLVRSFGDNVTCRDEHVISLVVLEFGKQCSMRSQAAPRFREWMTYSRSENRP